MQDKSIKTISFEALLIESGIGPLSSAPRDLEVRNPCLMEDGLKGSCKPYMLIEKSKKVDGNLHVHKLLLMQYRLTCLLMSFLFCF